MEKQIKRAYLEITNICNLDCSFCPITERDRNTMSLADFEKAIKQVAPIAEEVSLHLMGEPLAHPDFREILRKCEQEKIVLQLTTNGLLLERYADELLNSSSIRQINISLQSYMDNYPNKPFGEYLEKVTSFIDRVIGEKPEIYINFRLWNLDSDQEDKLKAENEKVFRYLEGKYQIEIKRVVDTGSIKSKKLFSRVYLHFDSRFEWPRLNLPKNSEQGRCHGLINQIGIHADGTVVPCCLDDQKILSLGNVFEQDLNSILESDRATAIRNGFQNGRLVEELCQKCDYIKRFNKEK
jgi:radical SAM protein with 4Fe4S-binding SPASM domain